MRIRIVICILEEVVWNMFF